MMTSSTTTHIHRPLVVKIGGGAGVDIESCVDDLARISSQRALVVVHGVSAAMDALCAIRGIPVRTLTSPSGHSSRYTDAPTRDAFVEAAAAVNNQIVRSLQSRGVSALGMMGARTVLWGTRKDAIRAVIDGRVRIIRDDYSGAIAHVNAAPILETLSENSIAVVPPLAQSDDGFLNIDGDRAGAALAGALGAGELIILSNVRGLYRSYPDESSFITHVRRHELDHALDWAQGRMKRKVLGASEALAAGVDRVIIADGRIASPISAALHGQGTEFIA
jgi:acetylglutamate/LysW-gamma-L-alpha-aminoadipate kinase